jgi:TctA family transporter
MPVILLFCVVGAFAINNSVFDVGVMLAFGLLAFVMEAIGYPIEPTILGVVLGAMLEQYFVTSMIKAGGNPLAFFERPIAAVLGILTILIWLSPVILGMVRRRGRAGAV